MSRPPLRVVPGGLAGLEPAVAPGDRVSRSAQRVVEAAQHWASSMMSLGMVELLDLGTEGGRIALALLDSVDEYEHHINANGPATAR